MGYGIFILPPYPDFCACNFHLPTAYIKNHFFSYGVPPSFFKGYHFQKIFWPDFFNISITDIPNIFRKKYTFHLIYQNKKIAAGLIKSYGFSYNIFSYLLRLSCHFKNSENGIALRTAIPLSCRINTSTKSSSISSYSGSYTISRRRNLTPIIPSYEECHNLFLRRYMWNIPSRNVPSSNFSSHHFLPCNIIKFFYYSTIACGLSSLSIPPRYSCELRALISLAALSSSNSKSAFAFHHFSVSLRVN